MDYYIGDLTATIEVDTDMGTANILASNLGKASHTNDYKDLKHKLSHPIYNFSTSRTNSPNTAINSSEGSLTFSVARDGYTPIALVAFDVSNVYSSSGSGRTLIYQAWLSGNSVTWSYRMSSKTSASKRSIYFKAYILYQKNLDNSFGYA